MRTQNFKAYDVARTLTAEQVFSKGMAYSNAPLDEGYCRYMQNLRVSDDGKKMETRNGCNYSTLQSFARSAIHTTQGQPCLVMNGEVYITDQGGDSNTLCSCAILGFQKDGWADVRDMLFVAQYGDTKLKLVGTEWNTGSSDYKIKMNLTSSSAVFGIYDSTFYAIATDGTDKFLVMIQPQFNAQATAISVTLSKVIPNDITANKAITYGYNMLKDEPYSFTNQSVATGTVIMDGLIPYDSLGHIKTNARQGEELFFHLIYRYPATHVTNNKKYKCQWEITDLDSDSAPITLLQVRNSQVWNAGSDIYYRTSQTTFKNFVLTCKLYDTAKLEAYAYESDILDAAKLVPDASISVAYYYLTADKEASVQNIETANYDLATATGMINWKQRIILWGTSNGQNMMWCSEINDPSYFPFPNNVVQFDGDIVRVVPIKDFLVVVCTNSIHVVRLDDTGLAFTEETIVGNINVSKEDFDSVLAVQNMVHFKSGSQFYLVTPVSSNKDYLAAQRGAMTLAPISRPIADGLEKDDIVDGVYMYSDLRDTKIHNWYRDTRSNLCSLWYDIKTRQWGTDYVEFPNFVMPREFILTPSSVGKQEYLIFGIEQSGNVINAMTGLYDLGIGDDKFNSWLFPIYVSFDTGNRDFDTDLKKRFKQIRMMLEGRDAPSIDGEFRVDDSCTIELCEVQYEYEPEEGQIVLDINYDDYPNETSRLDHEEWDVIKEHLGIGTAQPLQYIESHNVCGKGYYGSFKYGQIGKVTIYNIQWVYKIMNAR